MRSVSSQRRGPSPLTVVTLCLFTLLAGTVLTLGTLWALGVDVPFLPRHRTPDTPRVQPGSGVRVPLCAQAVPPYTKITLLHFFDPKTGEPRVYYMDPAVVRDKGVITDPKDAIGRVLRDEHPAGYPFTE